MQVNLPKRDKLIAQIPLFIEVRPLARPRLNWYSKSVYQPKENQKDLRNQLGLFVPLRIEEPVIVDTYINLQKARSSKINWPCGRNHGDEDNLRKAINDAMIEREIIVDDKLILGGENFKCFGQEAKSLVLIWTVQDQPVEVTYDLVPGSSYL